MLEVRKIDENDINKIAALEREIFSDPWSANAIGETLSQKNTVLLGAWQNEHLAGYLIVYYVLDEGEIARIAVESSCRRQGVAGHMMLALENFCEEKGIVNLMLDVRESNEAAIAFYKGCGFVEDGIRKDFYTDPKEDAILMSRQLGK